MNEIYRLEINVELDLESRKLKPFKAPKVVTFGWQEERGKFSLWHDSKAEFDTLYRIVATGEAVVEKGVLRASIVLPDGFSVFHLIDIS